MLNQSEYDTLRRLLAAEIRSHEEDLAFYMAGIRYNYERATKETLSGVISFETLNDYRNNVRRIKRKLKTLRSTVNALKDMKGLFNGTAIGIRTYYF